MFDLPGVLGTLANLAVIIAGFGAIIFVHELGHFLAAKWAGIRVLAFSMGMGPVLCSYRKGMGLRRGSTEPAYRKMAGEGDAGGVSPTEYRLSALPLGGYVKMLGQEDANPGALSDAPDSYQNCAVWKRMVVISAGVAMNLISAAALFVIVFMVGLTVQPPVVGVVAPDSPAAAAVPVGRDDLLPGLRPEDRILAVDGHRVRAFNEVTTEVAMGSRHRPVELLVERPGLAEPVVFRARAETDGASGLLDLGIAPPLSTTLARWEETDARDRYARIVGIESAEPGDRLATVAGAPAARPRALLDAAEASGGEAFAVEFVTPDGVTKAETVRPERSLSVGRVSVAGQRSATEHLLGLRPLMRVDPAASPENTRQGLKPGDVIVRIGDVEYPGQAEALAAIRAAAGKPLQLVVLRDGKDVSLDVRVTRDGTIGFFPASAAAVSAVVAAPLRIAELETAGSAETDTPPALQRTPAADLIDRPGTRIAAVAGTPVDSLHGVAGALIAATDAAFEAGAESFAVPVTLALPLPVQPDGASPVVERTWTLTRDDVRSVRDLAWTVPGGEMALLLFENEQTIDKAAGPVAAVGRGLAKSRQVMNQTYLTFLRLFQGTVKVSHLKGPVGIAHLGTRVADQGFIWVLFFLGLVSVNLAVINFLPLPIVDGGQFLMLAYEGIRRRPVPIAVQNAATLAGLVLIGAVFLIVTFHDIRALLGV